MIYLQITSGRGPVECEHAVRFVLVRMTEDTHASIIRNRPGSAIVAIDDRAYADSWIGTVLWICQSPVRKNHKRKNWFVGIREISLPGKEEVMIREQDCVWETRGASSKGGQAANKGAALIRLTHTPTGITVIAEDERSQKQNKIIALGRLREALIRRQEDAILKLESENWMQHNQLERGNPIRTFEGENFTEKR